MYNARIINISGLDEAKKEILKIGADQGALNWLVPKSLFYTIKLEGVSPFAANIIKQEMLSKGGEAAVNRGAADFSLEKSDVLLMGTYGQYKKLIYKLKIQSGSLKKIADEIDALLQSVEKGKPEYFECKGLKLPIGKKTYIMGILNVTPDSFSDGGKYFQIDAAVKRAKEMVDEGADIIDVGGESTRPGFQPVDVEEEISRVIPVVEVLAREINVPISVDTTKALVAEKALQAGAHIINDIWGLQGDPNMAGVVSKYNAGVVIMHNKTNTEYRDLMGEILKFLRESIKIATDAGIRYENIAVDPGIGFGKTFEQNIEVIRKLKELNSLNMPVLLGTSRKSLIGKVLDLPVTDRKEGTAATIALGIVHGVDIVRVHDVKEMTRVARMMDAMVREQHG